MSKQKAAKAKAHVKKLKTSPSKRAVVVIDRGWIFAGDVQRIKENGKGYIKLTRAVWVFRWESIGFDGVLQNPKSPKLTLRTMQHAVVIPEVSEIFSVPVDSEWGL